MNGKQVNKYHILEPLGEGGMAEVFKATDIQLGREVALKFLRTSLKDKDRSTKRFELEAKALARLDHPNIVKVLDYGEHEGQPYLVMDYIAGGNLKDLLGKPLDHQEAAGLLAPIADALAYAHQNKIIHRDIKPSNILLKADGTPMLADFGVAKILELEETLDLTGTGVGVGTPFYMAPEQGKTGEVSERTDIYSLGVVYYEMVTGQKPYQAETPMAVMLKHMQDPLPRPRDLNRKLPRDVERVLFKVLAKDPVQRYQGMAQLADVFNQLGAGRGVKVGARINPRKIFAYVLGLMFLGAVIVGGSWYWPQIIARPTQIAGANPALETETPVDDLARASTVIAGATKTIMAESITLQTQTQAIKNLTLDANATQRGTAQAANQTRNASYLATSQMIATNQALTPSKTPGPTNTQVVTLAPAATRAEPVNLGGLNLNGYCQTIGFTSSKAKSRSNANSWVCVSGSNESKINMDLACQWQYGTSIAQSRVKDENDAYSWFCVLP